MHSPAPPSRQAGFSLLEILLAVGVMAVLMSMATPPLMEFLKQKDIRAEQLVMSQLRNALEVYVQRNDTLPLDTITNPANANHWSQQLAPYTDFSAAQIAYDSWNTQRMYVRHNITENILGTPVTIWYATVHSAGPNRRAENTAGIAVDGQNYAAAGTAGWWRNMGNNAITRFSNLVAAGDDLLVKYTNYAERMEAYHTTRERMAAIGAALEAYSQAAYGERLLDYASSGLGANPDNQVFYPQSQNGGVAGLYNYTRGAATADLAPYGGAINNSNNNSARYTSMVGLMRVLGLPDAYCCSALSTFVDATSGERLGTPFYYFSNPRPRTATAGVCGPRPAQPDVKLPARITTVNDNNTCG